MYFFHLTGWAVVLVAGLNWACHRKTPAPQPAVLHSDCTLKHDPGPCRMALKRYYYDPADRKCKEFTYGGCRGVVPFQTLEDCQKKCGCTTE